MSTQQVADAIERLSGGAATPGARTVRRWENDTYEPNASMLGWLGLALACSVDQLLKDARRAARRAA